MMKLSVNGLSQDIRSIEEMSAALDKMDSVADFEAWAVATQGPSLTMLRSNENAFLMYLREPGDSGFTSRGSSAERPLVSFKLSNGQVDVYPMGWCIPLEQCYKAMAYFFVNDGDRPAWVNWHEG